MEITTSISTKSTNHHLKPNAFFYLVVTLLGDLIPPVYLYEKAKPLETCAGCPIWSKESLIYLAFSF